MNIMDELRKSSLEGVSYSIELEELIQQYGGCLPLDYSCKLLFEEIYYYTIVIESEPLSLHNIMREMEGHLWKLKERNFVWCVSQMHGPMILYFVEGIPIDISKSIIELLKRYTNNIIFS